MCLTLFAKGSTFYVIIFTNLYIAFGIPHVNK